MDLRNLTDEDLFIAILPTGEFEDREAHHELIRRYKEKKEELRIYGDHISSCPKRPCECGFKAVWDSL